jgi:hypothetical protein
MMDNSLVSPAGRVSSWPRPPPCSTHSGPWLPFRTPPGRPDWSLTFSLSLAGSIFAFVSLCRRLHQCTGVSTITSGLCLPFTSQRWASRCRLLSMSHVQTTAYHPQANGLVLRLQRLIKPPQSAKSHGTDPLILSEKNRILFY